MKMNSIMATEKSILDLSKWINSEKITRIWYVYGCDDNENIYDFDNEDKEGEEGEEEDDDDDDDDDDNDDVDE